MARYWVYKCAPKRHFAGQVSGFLILVSTPREVDVAQSAISLSQGLQVDAAAHDAGQRALRAAFIGFFVDVFDVYLPVVALGPAMSYFQPATLSPCRLRPATGDSSGHQ
jgi:hypothetical protein